MYDQNSPGWLKLLERRLGWLAIPQISILLVTLQAVGFLFIMSNPAWSLQLALLPDAVLAGEYWRVITFLALPLSMSPLWLFFALWFIYSIVNSLESEWGSFRTTFYVLISILLTIGFSLLTGYPVLSVKHFEASLFLAAAMLFPEMEIRLFFAIPAKLKWMGWLTGVMVLLEAVKGTWLDRFYLMVIYSNFLIFFGPVALSRARQIIRKKRYQSKIDRD